jgi:bifunctional ADP-heptose synthase (sugar kinase/adenylyltransferase)
MREAAALANHAAAVQVAKAGVATVTREEIYEHASTAMAAREVGRTKES